MAVPDSAATTPAREPAAGSRHAALASDERDATRVAHLLSLDTTRATVAYWSGIALVALAMFIPRLMPLVDYPQHLALADIARRLADPSAPEHATHQLNYFTYNGLFHILVARLSAVMSIESAGRVVVALSLALLGGAVLALVRVLRRPPVYAALATPVLFSFALGWGFVNYALGTALAFTASVFVARSLRRPTAASLAGAAIVGLLCAMTHVLAMLLLCLFAAALAPELSFRAVRARALGGRVARALLRSTIALAPLLVGAAWCIAVYRVQYAWDPVMYKDATLEGTSPPLWQKVLYFFSWATGVHSDFTDQGLVALAVLVAVLAVILHVRTRALPVEPDERDDDAPVVLPLVALLIAFLVTPMVFIGTHLIFPRLTQAVVIASVIAIPRVRGAWWPRLRTAALTIGVVSGLNLALHAVLYARETDDASRVIDETPAGRRTTAVVYFGDTFSFRHGTLVHLAAYYAARKGGDWSFSFARYLSVPVRFRPGGGPPWPAKGWEFAPMDYNPRCKYARHFDLLLVKAPPGLYDEGAVRAMVFGRDAHAPRTVSHHGLFWAFDTAGLPDDGTF